MSNPLDDLETSAANRVAFLTTPLDQQFLVAQVSVHEEICEPFLIRAELYAPDANIDFDALTGQNVTLQVQTPGGGGRFFNGLVSKFEQGDTIGGLTSYTLEASPWFWFLSQTQNCRIFPNGDNPVMSVTDILQSILGQYDGLEFDLQARKQDPVRYCVQYLESDFAFCSRIMEETGLGYYFHHEEGSHQLVIFDSTLAPPACPSHASVRYWPTEGGSGDGLDTDTIKSLRISNRFHPGKFTTSDFNENDPGNPDRPGDRLLCTKNAWNVSGGKERFEHFHYPGRFEFFDGGEQLTRQMADVAEVHSNSAAITGECSGFVAGHKFELDEHPRDDYNGAYLVRSIRHTISQPIGLGANEDPIHYSNEADCVPLTPDRVPYVPQEKTPKPIITGVQVATVVSPDGKGLDLDEKGCILVKFPWDRNPSSTSCRVRVSQSQAGSGWGGLSLPHVGQEVLVAFLGGDPDRPVVVGRVYNGANVPALVPEKQTRTIIKNHAGVLIEMEGGDVLGAADRE